MMRMVASAALLLAAGPLLAQSVSEHGGHGQHGDTVVAPTVKILDGYGTGGFAIRTTVPQAQAFFNNGIQLAAAFAHKAAVEAMAESARLDPACAMCAWGHAWSLGPTINYEIDAAQQKTALAEARRAWRLASEGKDPFELAMTAALVKRYTNGGGGKPGDKAWSDAMLRLAAERPLDDDLQVMAADSILLSAPAELKKDAFKAYARRAVALLEPVVRRNGDHTPAVHFYIHTTEMIDEPLRAVPYAERLGILAPRSQHLVHMPSHTFYWVGRYQDAATVNRRAVDINVENARAMGKDAPELEAFGLPYHVHNLVFGLGGALMAGDADTALYLARPVLGRVNVGKEPSAAYPQIAMGSAYVAMALFASPQEVMALPRPKYPLMAGMWHYARGESFARQGNAAPLRAEAAAIAIPVAARDEKGWLWQGAESLRIARSILLGRAAMLDGRHDQAIAAFAEAARLQAQPGYGALADPPLWWYPARRSLAEARLAAGDRAGARDEAERTLVERPRDPGALALLAKLSEQAAR